MIIPTRKDCSLDTLRRASASRKDPEQKRDIGMAAMRQVVDLGF
jgi:hypothetical protein